jgi:hypothetical protein
MRLSLAEISKATGVSLRTTVCDARAVRAATTPELRSAATADVAGDVVLAAETRERELWRMYSAAGTLMSADALRAIRAQLRVLRELRLSITETTTTLQSLGAVYRAPSTHPVTAKVCKHCGRDV